MKRILMLSVLIISSLVIFGCKDSPPKKGYIINLEDFKSDKVRRYNSEGKEGSGQFLLIRERDQSQEYLDINSIKRDGDVVYYSSITNSDEYSDSIFGTKVPKHYSVRLTKKMDCQQKQWAPVITDFFEKKYAIGSSLHSMPDPKPDEWIPDPDNAAEYPVLYIVCSLSVKNNSSAVTTDSAQATTPASASASAEPTPPAPVTLAPAPVAAVDNSPYTPSFDCAKASNGQEKMVCADRDLAKLDVEASQAYGKAREKSADKDSLKKEQLNWIKFSLRACSDKQCLVDSYKKRITELQ